MLHGESARFVLTGLRQGFEFGLHYACSLTCASSNIILVLQNPNVIDEFIKKEKACGRITVLYSDTSALQTNRFGVIAKGHQQEKLCPIMDLSNPVGLNADISTCMILSCNTQV